jgi:cytochrome c peroxidase
MARNVAEKYFLVVVSVQVVIVGPCLLTKISMHCPYLLLDQAAPRLFDPIARDTGRMGESDKFEDAYRFKTPSLRNVTLTAPYGHNGAYPSLEGIVRHHLDPIGMRAKWTRDMANLPPAPWLEDIDFVVQSDQSEINRQKQLIDINKIHLSDDDVSDIILFLKSLTGKTAELGRLGIPDKVPSGLSID